MPRKQKIEILATNSDNNYLLGRTLVIVYFSYTLRASSYIVSHHSKLVQMPHSNGTVQ
jgi:hypothetical protein